MKDEEFLRLLALAMQEHKPKTQRQLIDLLDPKEMTPAELMLLLTKLLPYFSEAQKLFESNRP